MKNTTFLNLLKINFVYYILSYNHIGKIYKFVYVKYKLRHANVSIFTRSSITLTIDNIISY